MLFLLSLLALLMTAFADVCNTRNAPACPTSGVRILDETYPVQTFVISQQMQSQSAEAQALPRRTMVELIRAYQFNPATVPNIVYPVSAEQFNDLKPQLIRDLVSAGMTEASATQLVESRLRHIETPAFTWQQDYFEATFDPASGQPRMNYTNVYRYRDLEEGMTTRQAFESITRGGICQMSAGPLLESRYPSSAQIFVSVPADDGVPSILKPLQNELGGIYPTDGAEYGGNMEGLPGGLCLVGNNMTDTFATQICGPASNIVKAEVNWLAVGHVDEIFKVVPDNRQVAGRPHECSFSILSADTTLGLSLLRNPSSLNQPTLVRPVNPNLENAQSGISQNPNFQSSFVEPPVMALLCPIVNGTDPTVAPPVLRNTQKVIEASVRLIFPYALAEDDPAMSADERAAVRCARNFGEVTNRQFVEAIDRLPNLLLYNQKIQESLLRSRQTIYNAILARLPQCRPYFSSVEEMFTPVPNYFSPPVPQQAAAHLLNGQLRDPGASANSFFPNPTNSVLANSTLLYPGPVPHAYREHIDGVTRRLGLTPSHLDTWDYAHVGLGNIHCSSHSIPYCSPAGGAR